MSGLWKAYGGLRREALAPASLALCMLLVSLGTSIANIGLPAMAAAFGATFRQVQWVVLAYLLAMTSLLVGAGRLGDLLGRRRLLLSGILLFTAASLLCGLAPTLPLLVAARALQGTGAAIMVVLAMASAGATAPREHAGRAMALLSTMTSIGTALSPSLGGALVGSVGWRALFLVNVPAGLALLLVVRRCLPDDSRQARNRAEAFDLAGTVLLALTLAAYALAVTTGRFGAGNAILLFAAAAGCCLFVRAERRAASPLIELALLRDPVLRSGLGASALVALVVMATLVIGPFHLSGALGLDTLHAGLVMSSGPAMAALAGAPAGRIVERMGGRRVAVAGLAAMLAGTSALSLLPLRFGVTGYVLPLLVINIGYAMFQAANNTAIMLSTSAGRRGVVAGMLSLARNLGLITGAAVMGTVFAFAVAAPDPARAAPASVAAGTRLTFAVAAAVILLAFAIAARTRPRACACPAAAAR